MLYKALFDLKIFKVSNVTKWLIFWNPVTNVDGDMQEIIINLCILVILVLKIPGNITEIATSNLWIFWKIQLWNNIFVQW